MLSNIQLKIIESLFKEIGFNWSVPKDEFKTIDFKGRSLFRINLHWDFSNEKVAKYFIGDPIHIKDLYNESEVDSYDTSYYSKSVDGCIVICITNYYGNDGSNLKIFIGDSSSDGKSFSSRFLEYQSLKYTQLSGNIADTLKSLSDVSLGYLLARYADPEQMKVGVMLKEIRSCIKNLFSYIKAKDCHQQYFCSDLPVEPLNESQLSLLDSQLAIAGAKHTIGELSLNSYEQALEQFRLIKKINQRCQRLILKIKEQS